MGARIPYIILVMLLVLGSTALGQETGTIYGFAKDKDFEFALRDVHVYYEKDGEQVGTYTNGFGYYELDVPADEKVKITISHASFINEVVYVNLDPGERFAVRTIWMTNKAYQLDIDVQVEELLIIPTGPVLPLPPPEFPSVSGDFNATLAFAPGVAMNNELSSGYSVRGGNFNENLVYVNDIQVYRPFLVRSGQQEGLSFVNGALVDSIIFSAGGWNARYGDKLSSVLDITYKTPDTLGWSVTASMLGASVHFEDRIGTRLTHIHGFRYKSNQYILGSLDVQGDYRPSFIDYQTFVTYDLTTEWELQFLGNYSRNLYNFVPENRETEFGNVNQALRLTVFFEGQEISSFEAMTGAVAGVYNSHNDRLQLKFIGSAFHTTESETFDILGQYWLDELERDLGDPDFGDVAFNRGVGTFLNHARNELVATVLAGDHRARLLWGPDSSLKSLEWGVGYRYETIDDKLSEWDLIDSAGFSQPIDPPGMILLQDVIKSRNSISSSRITSYLQNKWSWKTKDTANIVLFAGVRTNYWTFNNQFLVSPRANISIHPNWYFTRMLPQGDSLVPTEVRRNVTFRFATGFYYQPPFYRELRGIDGVLNPEVRAQKSIHFVASMDYDFYLWNRPFKFSSAIYYKHLSDLVPYEIDNVRIRYYAENNSKGYATGIDLRLNGEFIPGIESYASLGILQTREDILDDFYYDYYNSDGEKIIFGFTDNDIPTDSVAVEPGSIPRPTDQLVNFAMFFQDEMPMWPQFKVHLSLFIGAPLPFGPPSYERYKDTLKTPMYRRVDIGFSYDLLHKQDEMVEGSFLKKFKDLWVSVEVFNLLDIRNTINYLWIKDVTNRQYAIPNFLTSRRINIKLHARF